MRPETDADVVRWRAFERSKRDLGIALGYAMFAMRKVAMRQREAQRLGDQLAAALDELDEARDFAEVFGILAEDRIAKMNAAKCAWLGDEAKESEAA